MIEVSTLSAADLDEIAPLQEEVHALHIAHSDWLFLHVDRATLAERTRGRLADEETRAFIARRDGTAVGYAIGRTRVRPASSISREHRTLYLEEIGVRSDCRKTGVGRLLVEALVATAREEGIDRVEIDVWAFNAEARGFFERLGFAPQLLRMSRNVRSGS